MILSKLLLRIYAFGIAICFLTNLNAKETETPLSLKDSDITGQFEYIIKKSHDYEDYRVIKRWMFYTLKGNVIDSVTGFKSEIGGLEQVIENKNDSIASLNSMYNQSQNDLAQAVKDRDSLSMFGIQMYKGVYNKIIIGILLALIGTLVFLVILFKRSNVITVQTKKDLNELQEEYENHRKSALKRQEKVVRELYDEILKYKQMAGVSNSSETIRRM